MPDQKPPRLVADERTTLGALWQYHRDSLVRKVDGLDEAAARRRFVGSDTTLLWLVKHAGISERRWVLGGFAGDAAELAADDTVQADDNARPSPATTSSTSDGSWPTCWRRRPATPGTPTSCASSSTAGRDDEWARRDLNPHILSDTGT